MKLVLKVEEIKKEGSAFEFTCKDRFGTEYYFNSKCFKKAGSYILVNVKNFYEYYPATQYKLNVNYIEELKVLNNRLVNNKNMAVKSDYIKAVLIENIGEKGSLKEMEESLQRCLNARITIEDYKQETENEKNIKKLENKIKEYKRYYKVA